MFIGTRPSTIDITTRGDTWKGDGPDTGRCDDPAAATGHYRLEEACDWSIAHGAVTQLTDHIVCFLPDPTRAGRGAAEIGQDRPHTPVEIGENPGQPSRMQPPTFVIGTSSCATAVEGYLSPKRDKQIRLIQRRVRCKQRLGCNVMNRH